MHVPYTVERKIPIHIPVEVEKPYPVKGLAFKNLSISIFDFFFNFYPLVFVPQPYEVIKKVPQIIGKDVLFTLVT